MPTPHHPNTRLCSFTKVDGHRCGSPAWQEFTHCWHHHGLQERFAEQKVTIPPLDDQNAIQVAIMDVVNGLLSGRLDRGNAYTALYGIHIARTNLKGLSLVKLSPDEADEQRAAAEELLAREIATLRDKERAKAEVRAQTMAVARLQLDAARAQAAAAREKERAQEAAASRQDSDDSDQSLAEYLLRCLSEDSNDQQQAEMNEVLIHHGKKPLGTRSAHAPGRNVHNLDTQDRDAG